MITGFNTNVRHGGRLFHVQTEDSGRRHPHVISHVYYQGTILASEKSSYAQRVESADLEIEVRALMERQHKSMVARLNKGEFDAVVAERLGAASPAAAAPPAPAPPPVDAFAPRPAAAKGDRSFGDGIVSQKPLDEVILDYLVDKARARPDRSLPRPRKKR
jgi:hypothetical protein